MVPRGARRWPRIPVLAVNQLIDHDAQDPHSGTSNLRAYQVKIYKATPENSPFNNPVPCDSTGTPIIIPPTTPV
mgnify:CR=1 FL=1